MGRLLIEKYIQAVRMSGFNTNKDAYFGGNVTVVGTLTAGQEVIGAETITSTSANAFAVGRQGATAPVLNIDASTASVATGINIKGAAAAAGVAVSVISSGTNENLTIDAKGTGTISLNATATGAVNVASLLTVTSANANALAVGPNGTTNPVFSINAATASAATGLKVTGAAAGSGVAVVAISSGTNENLTIDAKGSGTLKLQSAAGVFAGGAAQCSVLVSTNSGFGIYWGSGAPTVSAGKGSIYLRSDGSTTNDRMYVNTNGSTTWTAVTTVA